ncbi:MAG TPA: hypothetical protein RMH85_08645 [Polyangiaceae bacterium LLY-WYZ-15_(1-7)]|nr:hypothetical protein [Myxococcales bacterium]MAT30030.1 hypothetical protein [Sandaracinus sp.]HJL01430.1 hypothetical protein [Polyangiaceae bacterium LLY-WYZ-15_(1-7)]MBJ70875.1 hypothetical protein [Sandaracinus sp.]HJL08551.1 hypothetical protein [Polyangiaceae bacterium LLY-WYZ-15_(1-7)]
MVRIAIVGLAFVLACGGGAAEGAARVEAPARMPPDNASREVPLAEFGRVVYRSLERRDPERLLYDDAELDALLTPEEATRVRALRAGLGARLDLEPGAFRLFQQATPAAICVQGVHDEPAGGRFGLREPGWVFQRALVSGEQPGGRRVAAWVEGVFVYSNAGFKAIDLQRVEAPRWEHADLEIATCDMQAGL